VPHDAEPTYAFRIDAPGVSLGFASDVGHVTPELTAAFAGVDVLAVEFNHDVRMQRTSGRPQMLIDRVLGDLGHLSNEQAATFATEVARSTGVDGLRYLIQLHLSRECNTPKLAAKAGQSAMADAAPSAVVVTATQFRPTATLDLSGPRRKRAVQPMLPGLELDDVPVG
jgi:phosphoribosyl 1,2-cyclic phosphodiesterase